MLNCQYGERRMKPTGMWDREVPLEDTLALVPMLRERFGITRVGDTTWLDRTGIPTFCAVVPATEDLITVYNGKGTTREAALVGAVMEAVERQMGAAPGLPTFKESIARVCTFIDLDMLSLREEARDLVVDCVEGLDLLSGDRIPVPLAMVQCPWFGEKLFRFTDTNGLASGNTFDEAVYHALSELIERHVWSMYHAKCHLVPRFFMGPTATDLPLAAEIEFPTGNAGIDKLSARIAEVGLSLRAFWLDEPGLPATIIASVSEVDATPPMAHMGLGCSLSPAHALSRAITECIQSRVVDIQAAREDILRPDDPVGQTGEYARRLVELPRGCWYHDLPASSVRLQQIPDLSTSEVGADVKQLLRALRRMGCTRVIVIDISPKDAPVAVVRMIVPEIETLAVNGRIGPRIMELFDPFHVSESRNASGGGPNS